jgi:hypothetical protein
MSKIINLFILFTFSWAINFHTAIGPCKLESSKLSNELLAQYKNIVIEETKRLEREYGDAKPKEFNIILAETELEFGKLSEGVAPEWSTAVTLQNPDKIIIKSLSISHVSESRMKEIIIHEINHVFLHRIPNSGTMPSWFLEGMAMRASGEFSFRQKVKISKARLNGQLFALSNLYNMNMQKTSNVGLAYAQSAAAIYTMLYYYNATILVDIIALMRKDIDFETAFLTLTGDDMLDFQDKYQNYVKKNYAWMFLLNTSNLIFVVLPIILVIGIILRYRHNKKIMERWVEEDVEAQYEEENTNDKKD